MIKNYSRIYKVKVDVTPSEILEKLRKFHDELSLALSVGDYQKIDELLDDIAPI